MAVSERSSATGVVITAFQMMHRSAKVRSGQRVLIHGASGGVGTALLQLGRLAGLEMYGTCWLFPGRKRVIPYSIQTLKRLRPAQFQRDLIALFDLFHQRKIKPLIAQRLPLAEARQAHELLGKGGVTGKIVLVCHESSLESRAA